MSLKETEISWWQWQVNDESDIGTSIADSHQLLSRINNPKISLKDPLWKGIKRRTRFIFSFHQEESGLFVFNSSQRLIEVTIEAGQAGFLHTSGRLDSPLESFQLLKKCTTSSLPHWNNTYLRWCNGAYVPRRNRSYFNRTDLEIGL